MNVIKSTLEVPPGAPPTLLPQQTTQVQSRTAAASRTR